MVVEDVGPDAFVKYKEIIKIRSRQHEHTSQCDGPAWLTSELGWSKPPHHVKVIHSGR
jgi:hypothetical protein